MAGELRCHWGEPVLPPKLDSSPVHASAQSALTPQLKPLSVAPAPLVQIKDDEDTRTELTFPVAPIDFLHSLQLQVFLKKTAMGVPATVPVLTSAQEVPLFPSRDLNRRDATTLLRQAVLVTCVDCGFDRATDSSLDLVTSACSRFLHKICLEMASHRETQSWTTTNECDYLYLLLEEIGFPVASLHHFVKGISDRKHERLLRVHRSFGAVTDTSAKRVMETRSQGSSGVASLIMGLEDEGEAMDAKVWDQSLENMSELTVEEILESLEAE